MENFSALRRSPLFRGVPEGELYALLREIGAVRRSAARGELLLRRGDRTERLGLVLSGGVHILRENFWGDRTILGLAEPGDVFAESYACLGAPLEVSVLAAVDTEVLFLNVPRMLAGDGTGRLARNLMGMLAGKNLALTRKMGHMARRTTREKLLSYLSAQALEAGGPEFDIPLDRQQLADYLAVERSAMSAVLGKLREEGVLDVQKNHFRLLRDPEQHG